MTIALIIVGLAIGFIVGYGVGVHRTDNEAMKVITMVKERATVAEHALEAVRKDTALQIANAYQQATRAIDTAHGLVQECHQTIGEARGVMKEAVDMSKTAIKSMFGPIGEDATLPPPTTVGDADRIISRRRREEAAGTKP